MVSTQVTERVSSVDVTEYGCAVIDVTSAPVAERNTSDDVQGGSQAVMD